MFPAETTISFIRIGRIAEIIAHTFINSFNPVAKLNLAEKYATKTTRTYGYKGKIIRKRSALI